MVSWEKYCSFEPTHTNAKDTWSSPLHQRYLEFAMNSSPYTYKTNGEEGKQYLFILIWWTCQRGGGCNGYGTQVVKFCKPSYKP